MVFHNLQARAFGTDEHTKDGGMYPPKSLLELEGNILTQVRGGGVEMWGVPAGDGFGITLIHSLGGMNRGTFLIRSDKSWERGSSRDLQG